MIKKLFALVILFLFPAICFAQIDTKAQFAYMIDYETGTVLYDKNASERMFPASMTKLMTATLVFEALKNGTITMDTQYKVSKEAWKKQGSKMFVKYNSLVKVEDLIRGVIVQSGNDACIVLAEGIYGSEEQFVAKMNEKAKELGLEKTNFLNSNGWPELNHYSTAKDLATIAKNIIKNYEDYYFLYSLKSFTYNKIKQFNRNKLLGKFGVDGMKTGFTDESGYGIVMSAKNNDRRIILVINGLASVDARTKEGQKLVNYGLNNFFNKKVVEKDKVITKVQVARGVEKEVNLVVKEDIVQTFAKDKIKNYKFKAKYTSPLIAKTDNNVAVGSFEIYEGEKLLKSTNLYPEKAVERISKFKEYMLRPIEYIKSF
jgi:D-alanyl-D-alanine carboxypeptidase (penicillin-binding protein 5/6)